MPTPATSSAAAAFACRPPLPSIRPRALASGVPPSNEAPKRPSAAPKEKARCGRLREGQSGARSSESSRRSSGNALASSPRTNFRRMAASPRRRVARGRATPDGQATPTWGPSRETRSIDEGTHRGAGCRAVASGRQRARSNGCCSDAQRERALAAARGEWRSPVACKATLSARRVRAMGGRTEGRAAGRLRQGPPACALELLQCWSGRALASARGEWRSPVACKATVST